jgi:hypothetical protein
MPALEHLCPKHDPPRWETCYGRAGSPHHTCALDHVVVEQDWPTREAQAATSSVARALAQLGATQEPAR